MRQIKMQKSKNPNKNGGSTKRMASVNTKVMKSYLHLSISYLHNGHNAADFDLPISKVQFTQSEFLL